MSNPRGRIFPAMPLTKIEIGLQPSANRTATLLWQNLRLVDKFHLRQLKRALRDFNITTGKWKS